MINVGRRNTPPLQGVAAAMVAAILFGISTPLAKSLLTQFHPVMLAGLFYLGSGLGLGTYWLLKKLFSKADRIPLNRKQWSWLSGAILAGGILAPILLMAGLRSTPASSASLLLNLEGVLTAGLAWFAFHEHFDRRIMLGMLLIIAGGLVLSWSGQPTLGVPWGPLAIAGACACWGLDNNFTRNVSEADPIAIAALKGVVAGGVNLLLGYSLQEHLPNLWAIVGAGLVGLVGYGISLVLFVLALCQLGTARTGAYFSTGPFFGALFSIFLLHEPLSAAFVMAALFMGAGVGLHLTERHKHDHRHEPLIHTHEHVHDEHHQHEHGPGVEPTEPHTHEHVHEPIWHSHPHFPDIHHRHRHENL